MRTMALIAAVLASALMNGCSRPTEAELMERAAAAYRSGNPEEAMALYQECLDRYPEGEMRPEAIFAMASIYQNDRHDLTAALRTYRAVVDQFPNHARAPGALFLIGFILHNELGNLDSARASYDEFLRKYPGHPMAASAEYELANLGKDPSSLLNVGPAPPTGGRTAEPRTRKR
jgi:TolA-binding protein